MLKTAFLYRVALYELKKLFFSERQKFSIYRKLYVFPSKASRFRKQNTACSNNFLLSSKAAFSRTKSLLFAQTFPYCHPKQSFSALRCPFQPPLTTVRKKIPFSQTKSFLSHKPFLIAIQSYSFPPSASHSHHP